MTQEQWDTTHNKHTTNTATEDDDDDVRYTTEAQEFKLPLIRALQQQHQHHQRQRQL